MNMNRMTLRQLSSAFYCGNIYIQSNESRDSVPTELTNTLKSYSGIMGMEVFEIYALNSGDIVAVIDLPAEWLRN